MIAPAYTLVQCINDLVRRPLSLNHVIQINRYYCLLSLTLYHLQPQRFISGSRDHTNHSCLWTGVTALRVLVSTALWTLRSVVTQGAARETITPNSGLALYSLGNLYTLPVSIR